MARRRETGGVRKRGNVWFIHYRVDGERYFESAQTGDERAARSFLAQRRREIREGTWTPPDERGSSHTLTAADYLAKWIEGRRAAGVCNVSDEELWMNEHVLPVIGDKPLHAVKRRDVKRMVAKLREKTSERTGRRYAPRTVLHVYRTLVTAFRDAVDDGLVAATPCTLRTRKGELPKLRDADPTFRANAVYTRDEAVALLSDERTALDRRVLYALMLLGGLRWSEAAGRRWRDLDTSARPLGRLTVASQADGPRAEKGTKTGETRDVPLHPALASILAEWKVWGFAKLFGRPPRPDDPIVPSRASREALLFRSTSGGYESLVRDIERLRLRRVPHLRHSMRATFLSMLEIDGANMAIARRATHAAPSDVVGGYIRTSWADLCREIAKLRLELRKPAEVIPIRRAVGAISGAIADDGTKKAPDSGAFQVGDTGVEPVTSTV